MATKDTPKKLYVRSAFKDVISCSRLCKSVVDKRHSKDLFSAKNCLILSDVQVLYGKDAIRFKKIIEETQTSFENISRSTRCVEVSHSATQPSPSRMCSNIGGQRVLSRRRSMDFTESYSDVSV